MFTSFKDLDYSNLSLNHEKYHIRYMVCQKEVCPTTGKEHVQGYVEFQKMMTYNQVKSVLGDPEVHLEKRAGSQQQAIAYCTKDKTRKSGQVPFILGKNPAKKGERTDLSKAVSSLKTMSVQEVIEESPGLLRYYRQLESWKRDVDSKRDRQEELEVIVLVGPPGTGKTRYVYEQDEEVFSIPIETGKNVWFDGYNGQKTVLFDDFYGGVRYHLMLKLLDRYPIKVPVKGGYVNWKPKTVYITSNQQVHEWYDREDISALERRISRIENFSFQGLG